MKIKNKKLSAENKYVNKESDLSQEKKEELFNKNKYRGYIVEEYNTIYEIDYDEFARRHDRK